MRTQNISYYDKETLLEGYLAFNSDIQKPRPAVLIAHDWSGRTEFVREKAEQIAQLGYVGFAIDMFGKGVTGKTNDEKATLIKPFIENRDLLLQRMLAALEALKKIDVVETSRIGAIGFCFGGLCVLDLARSGESICGVVSFHGLLNPPALPAKKILAKILVLHGHDDPMSPPEQVQEFQDELTRAHADWQMVIYGNTMHAFTNPKAHDKEIGLMYNPVTEKRSWVAMQTFFKEVFL